MTRNSVEINILNNTDTGSIAEATFHLILDYSIPFLNFISASTLAEATTLSKALSAIPDF